jgi:aspartate racemase
MGRYSHPEVSMHGHNFADYVKCIEARDWAGVAELMLSSAEKLARAGADLLIAPVNTVHQAFDLVEHRGPRPWLHIAIEVANEARRCGYRRLGILGTRSLMEGPVYCEKLDAAGIEHCVPAPDQVERIHRIIFDELVHGTFLPDTRSYFSELIGGMKAEGCDAVVLGCTEIPLLMTQDESPLPMLDSTRILARAALRKAAEG